jgi:hypothetical protein
MPTGRPESCVLFDASGQVECLIGCTPKGVKIFGEKGLRKGDEFRNNHATRMWVALCNKGESLRYV